MIFTKTHSIASIAICSAFALHANAEDINAIEEETIVSATRLEQKILDVPAAATIISKADFEQFQFVDVADALDLIGSADIVRQGGSYGGNTSLFTRGTSSDHTLMLVNGQRFSSATLGSSAFQLIDPALIQRVEYVRGSRSALYGSEALGGVMQINTYSDVDESDLTATLEAGSNNTYKGALTGDLSLGGLQLSGGLSRVESDGIDHLENDDNLNGDDDPFKSATVNLFTNYRFESGIELGASYLETQVESDYDSQWTSNAHLYRDKKLNVAQARFYLPIGDIYSTELMLGQSQDRGEELNHIDTPFSASFFDTQRDSLYWQNTLTFTDATNVIFGVDFNQEHVDSSTDYPVDERDNTAPFAQLQSALGKVHFLLGARNDDNSQFGAHTTGSASVNIHASDALRVFASWAEGFKAPTFNDLYWPNSGNQLLNPELSENYEAGVKHQAGRSSIEVLAFQSDVTNLIEWAPNDGGDWVPQNVGQALIKGVEANLGHTIGGIRLQASASYISPKDEATGQDLNYRAKRKIVFTYTHQLDIWDYGAVVRAYGSRKEPSGKLDAYELLDLFVNVEPISNFRLGLKVVNASDKDYNQRAGYNSEGRTFKATVQYRF